MPFTHLRSTRFDIAFRSGEEPTHASRADFLTQSALSSRRGFHAVSQGRVPRETLIKGAAWHFDLGPVFQRFVPEISEDVPSMVEQLHQYDLVLDDYRAGSSLRRESEAREQLALDLALSTDVYSAQPFKAETEMPDDDKFETMSRATEAMTLSETVLPSVHFGYLNPVLAMDKPSLSGTANATTGLALPPGVRLLLAEWDTGTDPHQYVYHDPYDDQQPVAPSVIPRNVTVAEKHGNRERMPAMQSQPIAMFPPPVVAHSQVPPATSSSQPVQARISEWAGPDGHLDSYRPMASTQVVPGPFGGRVTTGRKNATSGKKRLGGF